MSCKSLTSFSSQKLPTSQGRIRNIYIGCQLKFVSALCQRVEQCFQPMQMFEWIIQHWLMVVNAGTELFNRQESPAGKLNWAMSTIWHWMLTVSIQFRLRQRHMYKIQWIFFEGWRTFFERRQNGLPRWFYGKVSQYPSIWQSRGNVSGFSVGDLIKHKKSGKMNLTN